MLAADAVRRIAAEYDIRKVMAFGGEPLLHPEAVYAIMGAAREMGVPVRQVITNGCFAPGREEMRAVAVRLRASGVNDLLLSVDAFHQEALPLGTVRIFAEEALGAGIPVRLQPAWLVSPAADNPYNRATREILASLDDLSIPGSAGNVVFPEGNARKYLAEYFASSSPANPYKENPHDVRCVSFSPNGDVDLLGGNAYTSDIIEILRAYVPG